VIIGLIPEVQQHALYLWLAGGHGHAFAQHKAGCNLNNRKGQWIGIIRFIAQVMQL